MASAVAKKPVRLCQRRSLTSRGGRCRCCVCPIQRVQQDLRRPPLARMLQSSNTEFAAKPSWRFYQNHMFTNQLL